MGDQGDKRETRAQSDRVLARHHLAPILVHSTLFRRVCLCPVWAIKDNYPSSDPGGMETLGSSSRGGVHKLKVAHSRPPAGDWDAFTCQGPGRSGRQNLQVPICRVVLGMAFDVRLQAIMLHGRKVPGEKVQRYIGT